MHGGRGTMLDSVLLQGRTQDGECTLKALDDSVVYGVSNGEGDVLQADLAGTVLQSGEDQLVRCAPGYTYVWGREWPYIVHVLTARFRVQLCPLICIFGLALPKSFFEGAPVSFEVCVRLSVDMVCVRLSVCGHGVRPSVGTPGSGVPQCLTTLERRDRPSLFPNRM